jgi:hypothetical protein
MSLFSRLRPLHLTADRAELLVPRKHVATLKDPEAFVAELGRMHEAMEDLFGVPTGGKQRLILAYQTGNYGALWAYADGSPGHHIGVPPQTWPNLVVHELGHVAFWWDWNPQEQSHYLLWGGAVEGSATPTGAYACVKYQRVPAWIDYSNGQRDWASLDDFVNDILRGGVAARKRGSAGQDSVDHQGHGDAASMVEATLWDLFFRVLGSYEAYRQVVRHYIAEKRTREQAALSDKQKMEMFFSLLGRAAGLDLSPYLAAWGYDVTAIRAACRDLPSCDAGLPSPPVPTYGAITKAGWS